VFASKIATIQNKYADMAIGNITGTNGLNVFVAFGIVWLIGASYFTSKGESFIINADSLGYSVTIFLIFSITCFVLLALKRINVFGGGELGGPVKFRIPLAIMSIFLWILYLILFGLEENCIIKGF
jgi:solute carrier family 8 (sodium/calcium exchanger)